MRVKTAHLATRMAGRNFDDITFSILDIYGEKLGKRDGLTLSATTVSELIDLALSIKKQSSSISRNN